MEVRSSSSAGSPSEDIFRDLLRTPDVESNNLPPVFASDRSRNRKFDLLSELEIQCHKACIFATRSGCKVQICKVSTEKDNYIPTLSQATEHDQENNLYYSKEFIYDTKLTYQVRQQDELNPLLSPTFKGVKDVKISPMLFCVVPVPKSKDDCSIWYMDNPRVFEIDAAVFGHMFGGALSLLECPVIILTLPDGRVMGVPLTQDSSKSSYHCLCSLEQPVSNVHGIVMKTDSNVQDRLDPFQQAGPNHCNHTVLVIVGYHGKLVLIREGKGHSDLEYTELSVISPVVCSAMVGSVLIHSTGTDVYRTDLATGLNEQTKDKAIKQSSVESASLGYGRITNFAGVLPKRKFTNDEEKVNQIRATTVTGSTLLIPTTAKPQDAHQTSSRSSSVIHGKKIKDLLTSMDYVSERLSQCDLHMKTQDNTLSQLHLASIMKSHEANVSKTGNTNHASGIQQQQPVICNFGVEIKQLGFHAGCEYYINVKIQNNTKLFTLSSQWVLCVTVTPDDRIQNQTLNAVHSDKVSSYSQSIGPLPPSKFETLHIPVSISMLESLPLRVSAFLILDTENNVSKDDNDATCGITVLIRQNIFDIIHFLSSQRDVCLQNPNISREALTNTSLKNVLLDLAKQRQGPLYEQSSKEEQQKPISTCHPLKIQLPNLKTAQRYLQDKYSEKGKPIENLLLQHIMKDNCIFKQCEQVVIKCSSPSNHQMSLSVSVVPGNEIEITVQTNSMCLLVAMRKAIHSRLQEIPACQTFSKAEIKNAFKDIQNLEEKALEFQDGTVTGGKTHTNVLNEISDLYLDLRHVQTLNKLLYH